MYSCHQAGITQIMDWQLDRHPILQMLLHLKNQPEYIVNQMIHTSAHNPMVLVAMYKIMLTVLRTNF